MRYVVLRDELIRHLGLTAVAKLVEKRRTNASPSTDMKPAPVALPDTNRSCTEVPGLWISDP
jgi:hypothetical protein